MTGQLQKTNSGLKRRPFLTPVWLAALAVLVALVVWTLAAWLLNSVDSTTLVVVRAAETESAGAADAALSANGAARAAQLAHMFGARGSGGLEALYVAPVAGGIATAAPLAGSLGLTPVVLAADASPGAIARRALREHGGSRALIIADRDTVQALVADLGSGTKIAPIAAADYGTLYIVTVPRIGHAGVLRVQY